MLRHTQTENGHVKGLPGADPRITVYKGIPFAAPPIGSNRFRAPQPAKNWAGVKNAFEFAPIPMQDTPGLGNDLYCREWHVDPEIPMSEDCLYLNIWTPAKKADEELPVFVWFFGGAFQWGYTAEMEFDGERLARRGVIVVSVAYRLGVFGFMSHPEITSESPDAPGNFGLLDQQMGLKWVKRNIASFGGNPDNITVGGQSAGGSSVMSQITSKSNRNCINKAVIMSGIIRHPQESADLFCPPSLNTAENLGQDFFSFLGVSSLDEVRALDEKELRNKYSLFAENHPRMIPFCDGKFLTEDPLKKFMDNKYLDIPLLAGCTKDEFRLDGINIVEKSVKDAFTSSQKNGNSNNMYFYRFAPDIPGKDDPECFHSSDLWFFFETLAKCSRKFSGAHYELASQMCDYLAEFIKTGNPNSSSLTQEPLLPTCEPYTASSKSEMEFTPMGALAKAEFSDAGENFVTASENLDTQGLNPYLPSWEYVPDSEPYVFGDRVYIYGSHDIFNSKTFCMGDYVCWSAPVNNLSHWRYEGIIYHKTQDPLNPDGEMCLYAPDVTVGPDGRYYLYYVLDHACIVSVAVCDTPAGAYEFYGYVHDKNGVRLGERKGDEPQFDPGVLTEGDETFLYTGFAGNNDTTRTGSMLTVLEKDMLTINEDITFVAPGDTKSKGTGFEGHEFFEASSIRKRNNKYYFVYSSAVMHELCYATSDDPRGPFTYGGVIISNCDIGIDSYKEANVSFAYGGNNHGSIIQIGDKWYVFYHRQTNDSWFSRQGCIEEIKFREDGSIIQSEMTSCGPNNGPLTDIGEYPTYLACNLYTDEHVMMASFNSRIIAPYVTQDGKDGDHETGYITELTDTATMGFKYFDCKNVKGIELQTKGYAYGVFEVRTSPNGEILGQVSIDASNLWKKFSSRFEISDGIHALYLTYRGNGHCNCKSFKFIHN